MSNPEIDSYGNKRWFNKDKVLHREDGPAWESVNGNKSWWINGKRHREDGPARVYADGYKEWWFGGRLHREDGPAWEDDKGNKEWWIHGALIKKCNITEEWGPITKSPTNGLLKMVMKK